MTGLRLCEISENARPYFIAGPGILFSLLIVGEILNKIRFRQRLDKVVPPDHAPFKTLGSIAGKVDQGSEALWALSEVWCTSGTTGYRQC